MPGIRYVDRGGEQVYCQPFFSQGMQYCFVLEADADCLQRNVCDRYLNNPANGQTRFRPAASTVMLTFGILQGLRSTVSPYAEYGWFPEQEAVFWVLTIDEVRERLFWAFPYIWVDNAFALAMGREIYGFPKGLGWFHIPADPQSADLFTADTVVLRKYGPMTGGTRERLLEVRRTAETTDGNRGGSWVSAHGATMEMLSLLRGRDELLDDTRLMFNTEEDFARARIPMVFLKQFRDAADGAYACYQSIVEVPAKAHRFIRGGRLSGEYAVSIHRFDSHPIHEDLGLRDGVLHPLVSFWFEAVIEIGRGTEIWRASTPTTLSAPPFV